MYFLKDFSGASHNLLPNKKESFYILEIGNDWECQKMYIPAQAMAIQTDN